MAVTINEAKEMLAGATRVPLGFFPTPLHRLDKMSEELGVNLWIKRDDFTGSNLFGGNKTRKLEFLIGKALDEGASAVITYGATQSNHAMQTAWAAAKSGLKPILYLAAVVPPDPDDFKANLLLDGIYGAEIHVVDLEEGESFEDAERRSFKMGKNHVARLADSGVICYDIPMGGANEYGSLGYVNAMIELAEQMDAAGVGFDYLYHSTGSGGTMAGLVAGKHLLGLDMEIHSVTAMGVGDDGSYAARAARLANGALDLIGGGVPPAVSGGCTADGPVVSGDAPADDPVVSGDCTADGSVVSGKAPAVTPDDFVIDQNHYAPGYECPSEEATEAIKLLARTEGILVDPVYSGKAFAGLLADIRSGQIPAGSNVLFLHTGGSTVFFAEKEILGELV